MRTQLENPALNLSQRGSGVLVHVTSLPGRYGIGDLGPAAHQWIDMLADAGQRWWQMLPLGPIGLSTSPYQCLSSFAGNPLLISPEQLVKDGLLQPSDLREAILPPGRVNYPRVTRGKWAMLAKAYARADRLAVDFAEYERRESSWLDDFSLFMAIRSHYPSTSWAHWPQSVLCRKPAALRDAREKLKDAIGLHKFAQFLFSRQLDSLRSHARAAGVALIGDLPIFVSPESADLWTHPGLFQVNRRMQPRAVAGVPPDLFCPKGQLWGNPLYNWKSMAKDGFAWWKARLGASLRRRISSGSITSAVSNRIGVSPPRCATAETGRWAAGPGAELLKALTSGTAPFRCWWKISA